MGLLAMALSRPIAAALLQEESFSVGSNGWQSSGAAVVTHHPNGYMEGMFAAQEIPSPGAVSFIATNAASSGAYTGSYTGASIELLGFSFRAREIKPSLLQLRLSGAGHSFFRSIEVASLMIDTWQRVLVPLQYGEGLWQGGDAGSFAELVGHVQSLSIQVARNGVSGQRYDLDRVGTYRLPHATAVGVDAAGRGVVVWADLQAGVPQTISMTPSLEGAWLGLSTLLVQSVTQAWTNPIPLEAGVQVLRIELPILHE